MGCCETINRRNKVHRNILKGDGKNRKVSFAVPNIKFTYTNNPSHNNVHRINLEINPDFSEIRSFSMTDNDKQSSNNNMFHKIQSYRGNVSKFMFKNIIE